MRNYLFSGTCQFCCSQRTSCQSSGSSWKMFAATRISSSDDQYNLIRFDQYDLIGVDQYNLINTIWLELINTIWSELINALAIWPSDQCYQFDMIIDQFDQMIWHAISPWGKLYQHVIWMCLMWCVIHHNVIETLEMKAFVIKSKVLSGAGSICCPW